MWCCLGKFKRIKHRWYSTIVAATSLSVRSIVKSVELHTMSRRTGTVSSTFSVCLQMHLNKVFNSYQKCFNAHSSKRLFFKRNKMLVIWFCANISCQLGFCCYEKIHTSINNLWDNRQPKKIGNFNVKFFSDSVLYLEYTQI